MSRLVDVPLEPLAAPLPRRIRDLLDDADDRIERLQHERRERPIPAFVPCDFVLSWGAIARITELNLAAGGRFVEWGSGAGVVACQASLAGFDAVGIEIEPDLVDLAETIAEDHDIDVEFIRGSFIPPGADEVVEAHAENLARDVTWLRSDGDDAYEVLGLDPDDFDLVFAYPWPGEESVLFDLFAQYAAVGALLLTHHGEEGFRLQRKRR